MHTNIKSTEADVRGPKYGKRGPYLGSKTPPKCSLFLLPNYCVFFCAFLRLFCVKCKQSPGAPKTNRFLKLRGGGGGEGSLFIYFDIRLR